MIYLDSAATTLQKPPSVARATAWAIRNLASPGRGGHAAAMKAAQTVYRCREEAAKLFSMPDPENIIFTFNATHALNIAIKSIVKPGCRVVISGYEHNAVTRPLASIPDITISVARGRLLDPEQMLQAFQRELTKKTDAVICTHVSNVFGFVLPVKEIGQICREKGIHFIVDASQSAGSIPIFFSELNADYVAMPGHKGLYGPQGTGLLLCGSTPNPILEGGTGSESVRQEMPEYLPDRLEAGTHNVAGIAGLLEGLRYLNQHGVAEIACRERELIRMAGERLSEFSNVKPYWAGNATAQSNVLSFQLVDRDCEVAAEQLADKGFALRAGLHCAPLAHESAGTLEKGTIRMSVSAFNSREEIACFLRAVEKIAK